MIVRSLPTRAYTHSMMSSRSTWCAFIAAVVLMTILPGVASAQQACRSAAGTAALDEYCETIPTASGEEPTRSGRGASDAPGPQSARSAPPSGLDQATSNALRHAGMDGRGVLRLTRQEPLDLANRHRHRAEASRKPPGDLLQAVAASMSQGATLSGLLVPALLLTGLIMLGLLWRRLRSP